MGFSDKIQTTLYVFFLFLFSAFPIIVAVGNMLIYGGVLNTKLQFLAIMMIIPIVVIRKTRAYSIRSVSILLLVTFFIGVNQYFALPAYTYYQGRELLREDLKEEGNGFILEETKRDSYKVNEKVNRYIDEFFYYEVSVDNRVIKYVMNPVSGAYKILEEN